MTVTRSKTDSKQKSRRRTSVLGLLLALALLWTQMLGQVHRMVHVPQGMAAAGASQAAAAPAADAGYNGVLAHFSADQGQDGDSDCQRYDQLGHSDAPAAAPALLLPPIVPGFLAPALAYHFLKLQRAPFCARAPPVIG